MTQLHWKYETALAQNNSIVALGPKRNRTALKSPVLSNEIGGNLFALPLPAVHTAYYWHVAGLWGAVLPDWVRFPDPIWQHCWGEWQSGVGEGRVSHEGRKAGF